jgi:sarcosine oxidase subunit delta
MLIVSCPFCGPRDEIEFRYRGDASIARPAEGAGEAAFAAYVYGRDNPAGRHAEWWLHAGGCRQLLRVERDTVTHAVTSVEGAALPSPPAGEGGRRSRPGEGL